MSESRGDALAIFMSISSRTVGSPVAKVLCHVRHFEMFHRNHDNFSIVFCIDSGFVLQLNDGIDIFSSLVAEDSFEGRNIITMVTKYPLGIVASRVVG